MSVTLQTPFKDFTAAPGATLFSTDFRVILATDLVVRKDGVVQTSGFTVSGLGNPSGVDVTFGVPMVGGEKIELQRSVPLIRSTDYQQTGDFLSPVVNIDFDRIWMALQDSQFLSGLAILLPVGDPLAPMSIPDVATRASKFLAFDALGQAIAAAGASGVPVSAFMATLLDDLNAAAGRTTLGAAASGAIGASGLTMATARFLARLTAGTGAIEEITAAQLAATLPPRSAVQPIAASVAANALTLTLNPTVLDFRSSALTSGAVNTRTVAAPISLVISSGSTLGTINAVASRIAVLAIDNAGTVELAAVNLAGGVNLSENGVISTTAEGGAGAADSATLIYSTTARANVPYRVVGYVESTQAVAGTWATAPSLIQGAAGGATFDANAGAQWIDQTASRALNTPYRNVSGKDREIVGYGTNSSSGVIEVQINGIAMWRFTAAAGAPEMPFNITVPHGSTYQVNNGGVVTLTKWHERDR